MTKKYLQLRYSIQSAAPAIMPPLVDMDMEHADDTSQVEEGPIDLTRLSRYEREEVYGRAFSQLTIDIKDIARPIDCKENPDFAQEIASAYLDYPTFVFKVWINYDAATKKFVTDQRTKDRGKLLLTPKTEHRLHRISADRAVYRNIRLDTGMAFMPLAQLTLEVWPSKVPGVRPSIDTYVNDLTRDEHQVVIKAIKDVARYFGDPDEDVTFGADGFDLVAVEALASHFAVELSEAHKMRRRWLTYDGPWAVGNTAYLQHLSDCA